MDLLVWGINGKMGQIVFNMAKNDPDWDNIQGVGSSDYNTVPNFNFDVVIDFSHHSALETILDYCLEHNCGLVMGTTGHSNKQLVSIQNASEKIPVLHSSNMSLGMNLLYSLVERVASSMKDSVDIEIIETHHNRKKDAPSGSAKSMVEAIEKGLGEKSTLVFGRQGESQRKPGEIGVHSIRGGNIPGKHEVSFIHELESIKLVHDVFDRSVFAKGGLEAAKFIGKASKGLYSMKDVLETI